MFATYIVPYRKPTGRGSCMHRAEGQPLYVGPRSWIAWDVGAIPASNHKRRAGESLLRSLKLIRDCSGR